MTEDNFQNYRRGILYAIAAFTIWITGNACTKIAAEAHFPLYEIVCFMGSVGALIVAANAWRRGTFRSLWPRQPRHQFLLALLYLLADCCNVVAFRHLPLPTFCAIVFTSPMIVTLLAAIFLSEKLSPPKLIAILCGFGGALFAVHPWDGVSKGDFVGYLSSFANGFLWAFSVILTRKLSCSEKTESMVFNNGAVQSLVCGALIPMLGFVPLSGYYTLMLTMAGILQITGVYCFYMAAKSTQASTIAPCLYTQIITGAMVSYLVFHTVPTWHVFAGAAVIIAAGLYMTARTHQEQAY